MPFIPNTDKDRADMLKTIGVAKFDDLIANIPESARLGRILDLPRPLSEYEVTRELEQTAARNMNTRQAISFLGGGAYDHFIPAVVDHIISRSEFYTAYTPYQPEVSQGTLQVIYEYQSLICELTAMDVANASMYDGGSALAEAVLLAAAHTQRNQVLVSKCVNPFYLEIIQTYCKGRGIQVDIIDSLEGVTDLKNLNEKLSPQTAAVIIQHPNFFGYLEDMKTISEQIHAAGALFLATVDPISLGILEPPGAYGVDVAVGEGQSLGNSLNFGGPYLGIFTANKNLVRKIPGRIAGITADLQGRRGFVLTLQTREQHIRREKATSNICTNQALCALAATVYLALMGQNGLKTIANLCLQKSHYLAEAIAKLPGFTLPFQQPFFKEFVVRPPIAPEQVIDILVTKNIFAGIPLKRFNIGMDDCMLCTVTEKISRAEMDKFVEELGKL